jgi:AraC-like DNA-binding protein
MGIWRMAGRSAEKDKAHYWRPAGLQGVDLLRLAESGHRYPRHAHEGYAVGVVESGAHGFSTRGQRWEAVPGRVILVNPEDVHDGGPADADGVYSYRMLYLDPALLRAIVSEAAGQSVSAPFFPSAVVDDPDLSAGILTLHRALEIANSRLERDGCLMEAVLGMALRHAGLRVVTKPYQPESRPLGRALDYLECHFAEDVSLGALAELAEVDRFQLLRQFRRRFGLTPHAYQTLLRLRCARSLLLDGEPAASAAIAAGFADQSHMIRKFKAVYGVTPGQYRGSLQ